MAILTIEQRHDLGKAPLTCPSKTSSALYVHPELEQRNNLGQSLSFIHTT